MIDDISISSFGECEKVFDTGEFTIKITWEFQTDKITSLWNSSLPPIKDVADRISVRQHKDRQNKEYLLVLTTIILTVLQQRS